MYVDEPPKDGNIPDFNISKIDICPFRAYQRSFQLFQSDFSTDIHQRSRLLCFTQNDHTGQTGFKICPFLKWAQDLKDEIKDRLENPDGFMLDGFWSSEGPGLRRQFEKEIGLWPKK